MALLKFAKCQRRVGDFDGKGSCHAKFHLSIVHLLLIYSSGWRFTTTIAAKRINSDVQIAVCDTGIGIPSEHLPHIFDRFYRVDKSRSRQSGGGSGIGLTIAHALVEAHGGRIWVESAGEEKGSIFSFTLPVVK